MFSESIKYSRRGYGNNGKLCCFDVWQNILSGLCVKYQKYLFKNIADKIENYPPTSCCIGKH